MLLLEEVPRVSPLLLGLRINGKEHVTQSQYAGVSLNDHVEQFLATLVDENARTIARISPDDWEVLQYEPQSGVLLCEYSGEWRIPIREEAGRAV